MKLRPKHDSLFIRKRPDIHGEKLGWHVVGQSVIKTKLFGDVKIDPDGPVQYKPTCRSNNIRFAEVKAVGNGMPIGTGRNKPDCEAGDIICVDAPSLGHELPSGEDMVLFRDPICKWDGGELPVPLGQWVMCTPDEILYRRFIGSGAKWLLAPSARGQWNTGGKAGSQVNLTCQRILAAGSGELVNKHSKLKRVFWEVECKVGDGAVFMPANRVDLMLKGTPLTFVKWENVEACMEAA